MCVIIQSVLQNQIHSSTQWILMAKQRNFEKWAVSNETTLTRAQRTLLLNWYWASNRTFVPFNTNMSYSSRLAMNREECNCKTIRYCFRIWISKWVMKYFRAHHSHLTLWNSVLGNQSYFRLEYPARIFSTAVLDTLIQCSTKAEKKSLLSGFIFMEG